MAHGIEQEGQTETETEEDSDTGRDLMREEKSHGMLTSTNTRHPPTRTNPHSHIGKHGKQEADDAPQYSSRPPPSYVVKLTSELGKFEIVDLRFLWRTPYPWLLLNYHIDTKIYDKHPQADDPISQREAGLTPMHIITPPMSHPTMKPSSMNNLSSNAPPLIEEKVLEEEDVEMTENSQLNKKSSATKKAKEKQISENAQLNKKRWTWNLDSPREAFAKENEEKHAAVMEERRARFRKTFEELGPDYYDVQKWRQQFVNDELHKDRHGNGHHMYLHCLYAKGWGW